MSQLIAYFSRAGENYVNGTIKKLSAGNTEIAAKLIQSKTGDDMFKLVPLVSYSENYNECIEQAKDDQRRGARPELAAYPDSIEQYDTIYLGYPNYWGTMPMCVFTFLEHFDFSGKTIRPFCTHEGSGMGSSVSDIKRLCPNSKVDMGLAIHGAKADKAGSDIDKWLK
ncbi:MAG: flavodoxin [Oscillospiraceae bacterium]|nr:flavodoxin [Oscillospiraceae bacterium]